MPFQWLIFNKQNVVGCKVQKMHSVDEISNDTEKTVLQHEADNSNEQIKQIYIYIFQF